MRPADRGLSAAARSSAPGPNRCRCRWPRHWCLSPIRPDRPWHCPRPSRRRLRARLTALPAWSRAVPAAEAARSRVAPTAPEAVSRARPCRIGGRAAGRAGRAADIVRADQIGAGADILADAGRARIGDIARERPAIGAGCAQRRIGAAADRAGKPRIGRGLARLRSIDLLAVTSPVPFTLFETLPVAESYRAAKMPDPPSVLPTLPPRLPAPPSVPPTRRQHRRPEAAH